MKSYRFAAVLMVTLICFWQCKVAANALPSSFSWKREPGLVALMANQQIVWQFNFGTNATKPFFHPLALPEGAVMTWSRPADHPWHNGLWFSWKFINRVNYWEEDRNTGQSEGRTRWQEPEIKTEADFSARIQMQLTYQPATNELAVMTERRVVEISPPDKDGAYSLDWTMMFTAGNADVWLDRTPLPGEAGGQSWGGYAGLSVRLAQSITEPSALTSMGPVMFTNGTYRGKAMAVDYSGRFGATESGIAMLDAPANLNSPSPWYVIKNGMYFFTPAVICFQPYLLKARQSFSLRYRVVVHPGRWNREQLCQAAENFTTLPPREKSPSSY